MISRSLQSSWEDKVFLPRPRLSDGRTKEAWPYTLRGQDGLPGKAWLQVGPCLKAEQDFY